MQWCGLGEGGEPTESPLGVQGGNSARRGNSPAVLHWVKDQPFGELVLHDRVWIPRGSLDFGCGNLAQDIRESLVTRPVVGLTPKVGVYLRLVPFDAGERVLMLVRHAHGVPNLVQSRGSAVVVGQIPPEVHRGVGCADPEDVPPDVR